MNNAATAAALRADAKAICQQQPGYGTPAYRGDPYEAVALQQQAEGLEAAPFTGDTFGACPYDGTSITATVGAFTITAKLHRDDDADAPWDREDGHGPVSGWWSRKKAPGELVLNNDGTSCRFYDFAEAVRIARRDGWGAPAGTFRDDATPTTGQIAAAAARADFDRLKAWIDDEWQYMGVAVTVAAAGVDLVDEYAHALWGIESDAGAYLVDVANELAAAALEDARAKLEELATI